MRVPSLEPVLNAIVGRSAIPSAVVVVRSDSFGDATFIYGEAELGGAEPVTTAHRYRVGSITKSVTATIILQLLQEGLLALDDPVDAYVAGVPNANGITIGDLLNMRSGLFNYVDDLEYLRVVDSDRTRSWTPRDLLDVAFAHPSYFAAGTGFHYSNTNYILLGLVMEQVTGQSASELFAERVFEPLGMDDSSLPDADNVSVTSPYAHGYGFELDDALDPVLPIDAQAEAAAGTLLPEDWSEFSPSDWTAGGMVSTADDLVVWADALVGGSVLDHDTQQLRLASVQNPDGYGYGIAQQGPYLGHGGRVPGYTAYMVRNPDTATTVVALTGLTFAPDGYHPAAELAEAVTDRLPTG